MRSDKGEEVYPGALPPVEPPTPESGPASRLVPEKSRLARDVLGLEDTEWALKVIPRLACPNLFQDALSELTARVPNEPKRPLSYIREVYLPGVRARPRDLSRYAGDHLDFLTKEAAHEFLDGRARARSLGANSSLLMRSGPIGLRPPFSNVRRYHQQFYTPAKHEFARHSGRPDPVTLTDAVFALILAVELGRTVRSVSKSAERAATKDDLYSMGSDGFSKYDGPRFKARLSKRTLRAYLAEFGINGWLMAGRCSPPLGPWANRNE